MEKKASKRKELIQMFRFIYPKAVRKSPGLFFTSNLLGLTAGILIGLQTTVMAAFFNAVSGALSSEYGSVYFWGAVLGGVLLMNEIVNGVMNYAYECMERKSVSVFKGMLHEKAAKIAPIDYERTEFLDRVEKASKGATDATKLISEVVMLFTTYIPYLIYMGVYLFVTNPVLTLSLLIVFIPVMFNQYIKGKLYAHAEDRAAGERRKRDYYRSCVFDMEYVKETRLLHKNPFFLGKFGDALRMLLHIERDVEKRVDFWEAVMAVITLAGYGGVLALLVYSLLRGEIAVGSFAAIFSSVGMMYGILCEIVEGRIGSISRNFGAVKNFTDFLQTPEWNVQKKAGFENLDTGSAAIELKEVSFQYPDAARDAIRGINLTISSGETIAIVGENGAGKSTLMKIMMGLYQPSAGSVLIGGEDTMNTNSCERISAVFQRYQRYQMNVTDNVVISDFTKQEERTADESLEQAGMPVQNAAVFPKGADTMLSRQFGGKELSGGQWQRVAIARGIYRDRGILFLDEPTAAIDPLEESELYHQFEKMCSGKTAVIVTHRMGCARIADRIVVMREGTIEEIGTHEELYDRGRYYRQYWDAQAIEYGLKL
ncbi:MAG: ABC transporter ATP-binding protein/permease [Lachnospiraceae bacterium]|nr:ABC transporter ATP-binding protein/permease [Lachnospiraceae bacterium]MDE7239177.1 ABC transporter ATP-binding protein/permease [Lachnospiraceae bacterium]